MKEVYRSVKLNDSISTMSLSVMDQLRLMFKKVSNDSEMELESQERVTIARMKLTAGLQNFLEKAIAEMHKRKVTSVTIQLSSRFNPVLDEVINSENGLGRYYDFEIQKQDILDTIDYMFYVVIRVKGGEA